jgi:hypothetical protein
MYGVLFEWSTPDYPYLDFFILFSSSHFFLELNDSIALWNFLSYLFFPIYPLSIHYQTHNIPFSPLITGNVQYQFMRLCEIIFFYEGLKSS